MKSRNLFLDICLLVWMGVLVYVVVTADLSTFQRVVLFGIILGNMMLYELIGFVGKLKISFVPQKKEDE